MCNTFASLFFAVLLCIASLFFLVVNWGFFQWFRLHKFCLLAVDFGCVSFTFCSWSRLCELWVFAVGFWLRKLGFLQLFRLREFWLLQFVSTARVLLFAVGLSCASCAFHSWFRLRELWFLAVDFCFASFAFCSWFRLHKIWFLQLVPVVRVVTFCDWFLSAQVGLFAIVSAGRVCPWFLLREFCFLQLILAVEALLFAAGPGCVSCGFLRLIFVCASWSFCSCFGCASFEFLSLISAACCASFVFAVGFGCGRFAFCSWSRLCELWLFTVNFPHVHGTRTRSQTSSTCVQHSHLATHSHPLSQTLPNSCIVMCTKTIYTVTSIHSHVVRPNACSHMLCITQNVHAFTHPLLSHRTRIWSHTVTPELKPTYNYWYPLARNHTKSMLYHRNLHNTYINY